MAVTSCWGPCCGAIQHHGVVTSVSLVRQKDIEIFVCGRACWQRLLPLAVLPACHQKDDDITKRLHVLLLQADNMSSKIMSCTKAVDGSSMSG